MVESQKHHQNQWTATPDGVNGIIGQKDYFEKKEKQLKIHFQGQI